MDTKADAGIAAFDTLKLLVAGSILLGGIFGYYYYSDVSVLIRAIGVLLAFALGVVVALQSTRGQAFVRFVQGARLELRKVVWPTREETIQTTVTVLVFTLIMAVFFWLLDIFLLWFTRMLIGQGG
ncbi:MAG: preprotein translocase subunit SecE [Gammaproteobacteria bacterium]|nr:preprotein translocase subunit SecE [Gammaproteobacteria bacterium]MCZ6497898.1 preprotein translocase subunit SecE [Gammaproteobacteria bacterium]